LKAFVATVAAVFGVAIGACATGTVSFDAGAPGSDPPEGDAASQDGEAAETGVGATDSGAIDSGARVPADGSPDTSSEGGATPGDAEAETGPRDAAVDAGTDTDTGSSTASVGSCNPAQWVVGATTSATNNPPAFAVDGLLPTRWSTGVGQAVGQYFQIDFGGAVVVDQLVLDDNYGSTEEMDYARGLDILGSSDGINFTTTLTSASFATDPGAIVTIPFTPATVRAVRLQLDTGLSSQWWSIHELQVGCTLPGADGGGSSGSPDAGTLSCSATGTTWSASNGIKPTSWKATASSTGPNDTIAGAFDQSSSTRWSSGQAQAGGEWYQVDLGAATTLSGIALYLLDGNTTDYPSSYALQLSTDNLTFTTVATGLGAVTTAICFPPQSARYVRVTQTGTGDTSWWSIYEISAFP
jgi:F5/8 type C domain-containing protein